MNSSNYLSVLNPATPKKAGTPTLWGKLYGSSYGLIISEFAKKQQRFALVITDDTPSAMRLENELRFYSGENPELTILNFPDWETLPYDAFSPHQDIVSQRLSTLYKLPNLQTGILIVPVSTLMQKVVPHEYIQAHTFMIDTGEQLKLDQFRNQLTAGGYRCVSQVMEHGEYAIRGSLIDLFPMGSRAPYRIDLFDNEVESIRTFDPESQRSLDKVDNIRLLPAKEFPMDEEAIKGFRQAYRDNFEGDPQKSAIYRDISNGIPPAGIEYYLPLFFDRCECLFDYLPETTTLFTTEGVSDYSMAFWQQVQDRFELVRLNPERPPLEPSMMYLKPDIIDGYFKNIPHVALQHYELGEQISGLNYSSKAPPILSFDAHTTPAAAKLSAFIESFTGRILFIAETTGRREILLKTLTDVEIFPRQFTGWQEFITSDANLGITVAPMEQGLFLDDPAIAVITETQLYGEQVQQRQRRKRRAREVENIIRNLAELEPGSPVVHEHHGVGRYLGLQKITVADQENEFLNLEYAGGDKLYVPVSSLHLISRYGGTSPETAPLHRLGSGQWERAKSKAGEKIRDVAAELLSIYAEREARKGNIYHIEPEQYDAFSASFPFEETPDQEEAISNVVEDMASDKPMDRLICGDVGFGKTEVAMRAAFVAVQAGKQVAVLVPTTLLAQQHWQNFQDRFADWPVTVESLSRFRSKKDQEQVLKGMTEGTIDIVIGTHKLLQDDIRFKRLGMIIIDEEHRFGVRQKERFKALRAEVDVLTLTATPIPRTLNMALSDIRSLSVIASPPAKRLSIKTFVSEWNDVTIYEACLREIKRGGQVFFLHNEVKTIERIQQQLSELIPEASIRIAHGQMRERELEQAMSDFYHQRFNVLLCTTIIETGIDIPTANTIIINRADRFGLAQLYQLRGRVGRSHHRAYAYLITPNRRAMTADATKRLEALESLEELGAGFMLASHDLEIRGAGELLGDEQSGHIQEIGFSMYMEMLDRAVEDLKAGRQPQLDRPLDQGAEIDLGIPSLIPDDYLPDINTRLVMYKRIASASNEEELRELQVEMIDRFGLLPDSTKALFSVTELKLKATPLGIRKIELGAGGGRITFDEQPNIDPMKVIKLIQQQSQHYKLDGQNRLKLIKDLTQKEARIESLEKLIDYLAEKEAA